MGCSQAKTVATTLPLANDEADTSRLPSPKSSRQSSPTRRSQERTSSDFSHHPSSSTSAGTWTVMGKYRMSTAKEDIMGEGTSSICRKAVNIATGEVIAIKVYKAGKDGAKHEDVKMQKFRRQIQVLQQLQEPFLLPTDSKFWHEQLEHAKPSRLFMQLLDYSKDSHGNPGPDPTDGVLYVVTELAQYSLKDYLGLRRDQGRLLPAEAVRSIAKAIVLVMAGLHAKGLVHIDLKPENLMMFHGRLKLIDVDGCVKANSSVSIQDSSISFSPCYCAPEWAKFLIEESESRIIVTPALDAWSVGMTICELVTLDAVLKPMYANFLRNGQSNREAGFLFMDWLSSIKAAPIPKSVEHFDHDFHELLLGLLTCDPAKRRTCAQSLCSPFIASSAGGESRSSNAQGFRKSEVSSSGGSTGGNRFSTVEHNLFSEPVTRKMRNRGEDDSQKAPLYKGALFKLDSGGNMKDPIQWRRRDMWISSNGSLCYYSIKDNRRLVLIDCPKLSGASVVPLEGGARDNVFEVRLKADSEEPAGPFCFACESAEEYQQWTTQLQRAASLDDLMRTMRLGANMKSELDRFRLSVKNRRLAVAADDRDRLEPVFKGTLWKVKAEGDRMKQEDWFEREMWLSKNGSLVYWSKKEERELVYYTADDIVKASLLPISNGDSCRPWSFQVQLPGTQDVEFAPGEFAAESEEMRSLWIEEMRRFQAKRR
mmetsp:Transcript_120134/g.374084  ORF Transcript_120134/g.374084 Transcript_120134/m.374084 type:complete len:708 (+) Transcript_120134:60-2183(+)